MFKFFPLAVGALLAEAMLGSCSQSAATADPAATSSPEATVTTRRRESRADSLNGIPGHRFGEPLSAFPGIQLARGRRPGVQCYSYPAGTPGPGWFGKHQQAIPIVYYVFKDGKFASFQAYALGPNRALLREEAAFLFGPGTVGMKSTTWAGEQVRATYAQQFTPAGLAEVLTVDSRALLATEA
ncbi:MAG: hypothetical protein ACRYG7_16850 [Janthinobacterium lividum]